MIFTYAGLQSELRKELSDETSEGLEVIKQFINDVGRDMWYRLPWPFRQKVLYFSTVSGTREYDLSTELTNFLSLTAVNYKHENETYYTPLQIIDLASLIARFTDTVTTGRPSRCALKDDKHLILHQTPNFTGSDNVEVWFDSAYTELSADADIPLFPQAFWEIWKDGVRAKYYDWDDDTRAQSMLGDFERGMGKMVGLYFNLVPMQRRRGKLFRR